MTNGSTTIGTWTLVIGSLIGIWDLELGILDLGFGTWDMRLGIAI
jgi:hypothetical protein